MNSEVSPGAQVVSELNARIEQLERNQVTPEDRLKLAIFDQIPFTKWASTRDFKIVLWNPYCEKNYGYSSKDAVGKDYVELFVDDMEADDSRSDCLDVIERDKQFRNFLAYDHAKDGGTKTMLTNCFRVYDEGRNAFLQVEVGVDANELNLDLASKRLHSLREYAQKRKAEQIELIQIYRAELVRSISDAFHRKTMALNMRLMEIQKLRAELKGISSSNVLLNRANDQEREIDAELKRLQDDERRLIRQANEVKTLDELKQVRD